MKSKKGFTLVELLAVVVIMSILALIAIPIVINIIRESRENANKQSILNYAKAVEKDIVSWKTEDTARQFIGYENVYKERDIKVSGDKVSCEKAIVDKEGELTLKKCYLVKYENEDNKRFYDYINGQVYEIETDEVLVSEYAKTLEENYKACKQNTEGTDYLQCALSKMNELEIECAEKSISSEGKAILKSCYRKGTEESKRKYYNYENGKLNKTDDNGNSTNGNSTTGYMYTAYNVGDAFTINGYSYHVIADSPIYQDYVVALKDEPLTFDEVNMYGSIISLSVTDKNGYGAIVYGSSRDYVDSNIKNIIDSWVSDQLANINLKTVNEYKARLITYEELLNSFFGYKYDSGYYFHHGVITRLLKTSDTPEWIYNYSDIGYWTMSSYDDYGNMWAVKDYWNNERGWEYGCVSPLSLPNVSTIRPVINIYKGSI